MDKKGRSAFIAYGFCTTARARRRLGISLNACRHVSLRWLKCLEGKSLEDILTTQDSLAEWGCDPFTPFGQVVEPDLPGAFISEDPKVSMETGRFNKVPLMTGVVKDEGILMHSALIPEIPELQKHLHANWKKVLPITLQIKQVMSGKESAVLIQAPICSIT